MEIHIQLANGKQYAFALKKDANVSGFLGALRFWEIFDGGALRISNGETCWTFNSHLVEKIRFLHAMNDHWWSPENLLSRKFVSEPSYRRKLAVIKQGHGSRRTPFQPGEIVEGLAELILASGCAEYLAFMVMLRPPQEQMMDLSIIFQRPPFPIPTEDGGFVLLNPANISMVRIYPALIEDGSDWPLDVMPESPPTVGETASIGLGAMEIGI